MTQHYNSAWDCACGIDTDCSEYNDKKLVDHVRWKCLSPIGLSDLLWLLASIAVLHDT